MAYNETKLPRSSWTLLAAVVAIALMTVAQQGTAQTTTATLSAEGPKHAPEIYRTLFLSNVGEQRDTNEILLDLRNMLPMARAYLVSASGAITVRGSAEDVEEAQKIVSELDRPRKAYRLTYTIAEVEGGKRTAVQRYALVAICGEKAEFKQGSRIPVVTGMSPSTAPVPGAQVQYIDVGLNITAWLDGGPDGLRLRSKVERTNLSEEKSGVGVQDPIVRQSTLETMTVLAPGKSVVLGSFGLPGTEKRQELEVVPELVRF